MTSTSPLQIDITRTVTLPDLNRLELYRRSPELGPRILFFSGGSALRKLSRELSRFTHNSIHIITPFDSGGSSAKLREAFRMPAIGDVRNRLMALADRSQKGNPEIFRLFSYRFPTDGTQAALRRELDDMALGRHVRVKSIPDPMRKIIRNHLRQFQHAMPRDFDLAGASIGNLILTAGYLDNRRHLDPVIYIFSKLVGVLGTVRPVTNRYLHLVAEMQAGAPIVGQHRLTGKESDPISRVVKRVYLSETRRRPQPVEVPIRNKMKKLIGKAELICYPMGSFYTSLVANLLPKGVGKWISRTRCPKIFIPNTGKDPELLGKSLMDQVEELTDYLIKDVPDKIRVGDILNFILVDPQNADYPGALDRDRLRELGIGVIECELIRPSVRPDIDAKLLAPILLSLT